MPNKKSAAKELRKSVKRTAANRQVTRKYKELVKDSLKKVSAGDKKVKDDFKLTAKALDKAAKKGVLKKNTASRKKSRLAKKINSLK